MGKGSTQRKSQVDDETLASNWDRIFGKKVSASDTSEECVDETQEEEHDEDYICPSCSGSGEGMYDGAVCHKCKGTGGYPKQYLYGDDK